ncbi:MAG: hypothetical protein ACYCTB_11050 [bacterium]
MFGISNIIGAIIALFVVVTVGIGVANYYNRGAQNQNVVVLAQQTAYYDDVFANALNSYVNANFNNNIMGTVNCSTIQSGGFLSKDYSCTDPIGETLEGDISEPWGFPQTWIVYNTTVPNIGILKKYGINSVLKWKEFTYLVAEDSMNDRSSFEAFSADSSGNISSPQSGNVSVLADYFPTSGVEFPQTVPVIDYYDGYSGIIAPNIQKKPDYWVFNVSVTENYNNGSPSTSPAAITYTNLGDSAVCPSDGIIPIKPTNWEFNIYSLPPSQGAVAYNSIPNQYNYTDLNFFLCIPAAKETINTSNNIFSNIGPITSLNYDSDEMQITDGETFNGAANSVSGIAPQTGMVYNIKDGITSYTFMAFVSLYSSGYYNKGSYQVVYGQYITAGGVLWIGAPPSNICITSSDMNPAIEVSPNAYPPCWNAINDLGLTNINLR